MPAALVAFVAAPDGRAAIVGDGRPARRPAGPARGPRGRARAHPATCAGSGGRPVRRRRSRGGPACRWRRCWDVAEAHRLLAGGWEATPQVAWAAAYRLDRAGLPAATRGDLFDFHALASSAASHDAVGTAVGADASVVRADGYLDPDAGTADWRPDDDTLAAWGRAALACAGAQEAALAEVGPRSVAAAHSESAAAFLCVELARDGLPVDRATAERMIARGRRAAPRRTTPTPVGSAPSATASVLAHTPGRESTDLRNPLQVKELLASVGVVVPNTRKWVLEPFRDTHAVVGALLEWRKAERIATTYGYPWLDAHVGSRRPAARRVDGLRRRGRADDGTERPAQPAHRRCARPWRPTRVTSSSARTWARSSRGCWPPSPATRPSPRRPAPTTSTRRWRPRSASTARWPRSPSSRRCTASAAVRPARPSRTSSAPTPSRWATSTPRMPRGCGAQPLRTFGGRLIRLDAVLADVPADGTAAYDAARGRFARNAVIQGSAAELFKAWAATVRATTRDLGAQIVLCLHDELLVHVPEENADETMARLERALTDSARRWTGSTQVRFVADASVIHRWSEAKD